MPKRFDFGDVILGSGGDSAGVRSSREIPFCIAVLGDFRGCTNRRSSPAKPIAERYPVLVDHDNFDEVLSNFAPAIELPLGDDQPSRLCFSELDDFHPDRVFERLEAFGKLRDLRFRLKDPSTFEDAAKELGLRDLPTSSKKPGTFPLPPASPRVPNLSAGSLLDEMIEQTESLARQDRKSRVFDEIREFARRVAEQHRVSAPDPRQPEILAVIDRAIAALMRSVLHTPDFQSLEAAWRSVFFLVRRLETSSQLKLYLVDISKEELIVDLCSGVDVRNTQSYRLLVEKSVKTLGAEPWAVLVGDFAFGPKDKELEALSRMAQIANCAGAPFLAQADPQLLGCRSLASIPSPRDWKADPKCCEAWRQLRNLPEAEAIGLALPRFLLRLPYGQSTCPLESFDLEEFSGTPVHEEYLWGNPTFVLALLLGQGFSQSGWRMQPGRWAEIDGLPLHIHKENGVSEAKPCAEVLLTEEVVKRILAEGIMPLVSFKNSDRVRVARFQSIGDPPRALAARWMK